MSSESLRSDNQLEQGVFPEEEVLCERGGYSLVRVMVPSPFATGLVDRVLLRQGDQPWHETDDAKRLLVIAYRLEEGVSCRELQDAVGHAYHVKSHFISEENAGRVLNIFAKYSPDPQNVQDQVKKDAIASVKGIGEPDKVLTALRKGRMNVRTLSEMERRLRDACEGDVSRLDQALQGVHAKILETLIGKEIKKDERKAKVSPPVKPSSHDSLSVEPRRQTHAGHYASLDRSQNRSRTGRLVSGRSGYGGSVDEGNFPKPPRNDMSFMTAGARPKKPWWKR